MIERSWTIGILTYKTSAVNVCKFHSRNDHKESNEKNDEQQQHNKAMQKQIKRLSNEMGNVTFISLTEKNDEWQERIMKLELKVLEMDSVTQAHQIRLVRDCITQLHLNVRATDERLREMESNKKSKVDS